MSYRFSSLSRSRLAALVGFLVVTRTARAEPVEPSASYAVEALTIEGPTADAGHRATIEELLPRPLPLQMTGSEIVELRRRIKNLTLYDRVEVEPTGRTLTIQLRRKTTIAPIIDFSSGKTLGDSKLTLGAIEHNIDGKATRLGARASYSERGFNFGVWLHQHVYRPRAWANEYDVYYASSGFRFEGPMAGTKWDRNRFGGEVEFLSPFSYGTHFRYEFQLNVYRELLTAPNGPTIPADGIYFGTTSEVVYDRYTWNDLTPNGFRAALEFRPGIFIGAAEARHEGRAKATAALKLTDLTALVFFTSANLVNTGNPNHSGLIGSQAGVRGLPDSLYRTRAHAYSNLELRHAIDLGKRWYLQGVLFSDAALFEPMGPTGDATTVRGAWSTGAGIRVLPTALVDTLLRIDGARLHQPTQSWFIQFGITQYI